MVGYHGSGKTTITQIFEERGYGDEYKTPSKMLKKEKNILILLLNIIIK